MTVIAVANQKGGVGKTTTVLTTAAILGDLGKKVLIVDCDSQHNSTSRLEEEESSPPYRLYDLFEDEEFKLSIAKAILPAKSSFKNVYYIEGDARLAKVDSILSNRISREKTLKKILAPIIKHFDFIFLDTPPAINALTINALTAADKLIIPCDLSKDGLEGAKLINKLASSLKKEKITSIELSGIVVCGLEKSNSNLVKDLLSLIRREFADKVYNIEVPATVKVGESALAGATPYQLFRKHPITKSYEQLAKNLI